MRSVFLARRRQGFVGHRQLSLVCLLLISVISVLTCARPAAIQAATLPSGFQDITLPFSGLSLPTDLRFAADGRVFVAEKAGLIKVFDSLADPTPTVFANLSNNVYSYWDRGLLSIALAPNFPADPSVYVLYAYDAPIGGTAPRWRDGCPAPPGDTTNGCVISGRLSRLIANGNVMTGTEQVLIEDWCQQFPSHSIGNLEFDSTGALYVSGGDGANFNRVDYGHLGRTDGSYGSYPRNPCGDPPTVVGTPPAPPLAEGGALRSQDLLTMGDPVGLDGALLRIDPATGAGLPSNPLASSSDPNARRIIANGFRNPFRFTIRPSTNEIWAGDVGWQTWEEINRVDPPSGTSVQNLGWPCYEGSGQQAGYAAEGLSTCTTLYSIPNAVSAPAYAYRHGNSVVSGDGCPNSNSSITGLAFYTGNNYPTSYKGGLFFLDYSRGCMWFMPKGSDDRPVPASRSLFAKGLSNPISLRAGPASSPFNGDLFYIDHLGGTIHQIRHSTSNRPPTAVIRASPSSGILPLVVSFDGRDSFDPDPGDSLVAYAWDLDGDGEFDDGASTTATYTYTDPGTYNVQLRVTDSLGLAGTSSFMISANNTAPLPVIDTPTISTTWQVGDLITFSGHATDLQDGELPGTALHWLVVLHHCSTLQNCHAHPLQIYTGATASFNAPDHEYPSYLEFRLTATDSGGLQQSATLLLYPRATVLGFNTDPPGLQLTFNGASFAAPFTRTVIVGSGNSVAAVSPQELGGNLYEFAAWSDGGDRGHEITAGAASTIYTATFTLADLPTATSTPTGTRTPTSTPTLTNTPTSTQTPTNTPTSVQAPTDTPTGTQTPTGSPTPRDTPTATPTSRGDNVVVWMPLIQR